MAARERIGWGLLALLVAGIGSWRLLGADASSASAEPTATLAERTRIADAIAVGLAGGDERGVDTARGYLERWGEEPTGLAAIAHAAIGRGLLAQTCDGAEDGLCVRRRPGDARCGPLVWGQMHAPPRTPAAVLAEARHHLERAHEAAIEALPEGTPQRQTAAGARASATVALADLDLEAFIREPSWDGLEAVVGQYRAVTVDPYWTPVAGARVALAHIALADTLACRGQRDAVAGLVREAFTSLQACAEAVRKRRRGEPERTLCIRLLSAVQGVRTVADDTSQGGGSR